MARAVLLSLLCIPALALAQETPSGPAAALLDGVGRITAPGCLVGTLSVYGAEAEVVLTADSGGAREALVAAASYGEGRVVALAHDGLLGGPDSEPGNARFLANAVRWAAGDRDGVTVGLRGHATIAQRLEDAGFTVVALSDADYRSRLAEIDVLITGGYDLGGPEGAQVLRGFVEGGGGVLVGVCPWGWLQVSGTPNEELATALDGNRLLAPMGLVFADGTVEESEGGGFRADGSGLTLAHAGRALAALADHVGGGAQLSGGDLKQVGATLTTAIRSIPPDDASFLPQLRDACSRLAGDEWPTPATPVKSANPFARIRATLTLTETRRLPAEEVTACPAAEGFPGPVAADAPRVLRDVRVDTAVPDWHSTGLYAPPGGLVYVLIPSAATELGLSARIGCHTDGIWHLDEWKRFPEISRTFPLRDVTTAVASPFGGLIYIQVPRGVKLGLISVSVDGAVEAPYFVRGETDLEEWRTTIRNAPAPWGELQANSVILSLPSEVLRTLDDPESLLAFWDEMMDACADLAAIPRERERPERYVSDVQISAGYMHSGYPIMTWLDVPKSFVNLEEMRTEGNWGAFHEMGHNHQQGDWTFDGTVEVTVNLFSLYVCETVCGLDPGQGHGAMAEPGTSQRRAKYLADGARFETWKSDPFLALTMYYELRQAFGWEPYKQLFAEYLALPANERPRNDDEKRDQWMVRFSRTIGRNLGPFFEAWGVPTSQAARDSIADLPAWMPEDWPTAP